MDRECAIAYNKYSTSYKEKRFEDCLNDLTCLNLEKYIDAYPQKVDFVIRSSFRCLFHIKNNVEKHRISVANAFKSIMVSMTKCDDFTKMLTMLKWFTMSNELESVIPMLASIETSEFDLHNWIHTINNSFDNVFKNATEKLIKLNDTEQKLIYMDLTRVLLFFVNCEMLRSIETNIWNFSECERFLRQCQSYKIFNRDQNAKQYNICLKLLTYFIEGLNKSCDDDQFSKHLEEFFSKLKSLTKSDTIRSSLTQDNFITVARIVKICSKRFIDMVTAANAKIFIGFVANIGNATMQMKLDKLFCSYCKNVGIHCGHDVVIIVLKMFSVLCDTKIDNSIIDHCANIIHMNLESLAKLECAKAAEMQQECIHNILKLTKICTTKDKADLMIPIYKRILKYYQRRPIKVTGFDETIILNNLFNLLKAAEKWDEMISIGYQFMAIANESSNLIDSIVWNIGKYQINQKVIQTPFDYFGNKNNQIHTNLPSDCDVKKIAFLLMKIAHTYGVLSSELSNKLIQQLIMYTKSTDENPLQFVYYTQSMALDKMSINRIERLTNELRTKKCNNPKIALRLAVIEYFQLNQDVYKTDDVHMSVELSADQLASDHSVFQHVNLSNEMNTMKSLLSIKKAFIDFIAFYLSSDRCNCDDEVTFLLRETNILANKFIVRGYIDDGFQLYMELFQLAKANNDEFGVINACSFFAENSNEFKKKFPAQQLSSVIEQCFGTTVQKLKDIKQLSTRKQTQLCFCILNLVLYYYEDGGDHKRKIHIILMFIFKLLDGFNNRQMEEAMHATVGTMKEKNIETPIINSEAIRIKFYSILFTIVVKYGARSAFHPGRFIEFVMIHLKKHINIYYESTTLVAILLYNMLPQMTMWLHSVYEYNEDIKSLLLTLLKLAIRSGYAQRSLNLLVMLLQIDLLSENLTNCKNKFVAIERLLYSNKIDHEKCEKSIQMNFTTEINNECEPIRKQGILIKQIKSHTPNKNASQNLSMNFAQFLPLHSTKCECGICFSSTNTFLVFCAAVSYARYAYINDIDFNVPDKRCIFKRLFDYWESHRNDTQKFPKGDMFYLNSARMLLYYGHFQWKFDKTYVAAKELLIRAKKGLDKIIYGDGLLKKDIQYQIDSMEKTIVQPINRDERFANIWILNRKKDFTVHEISLKKTALLSSHHKPNVRLLDFIVDNAKPTSFQIHSDDIIPNSPEEMPLRRTRKRDNVESVTKRMNKLTVASMERPKRITRKNIQAKKLDLSPPEN